MNEAYLLYGLGAATAALALPALRTRLELSRAKHPSLTGHSRMARRVAGMIPYYAYDEARFYRSDGAPDEIEARRRAGFARLADLYRERYPRSAALTAQARENIPDLAFTGAYRVPFQYSHYLRQHLTTGTFVQSSSGVTVTDLDGNRFYDLAGSYGVNLFGYDFYKSCMAEGSARAAALGPVLGAYHPAVAYNVRRLREVSGLDEVSFHMSGTEAVMQAVRLARY
ncbi:MAG: aminotransferase class III-fold pyridoxal phosphate-dependent enzyme, partial [Candidatus Parcubacteria bacterium]|nr:aminotransferase class III-fold pyridoxal phosphate-dependent enzyme [Burkholderiales bacterium]